MTKRVKIEKGSGNVFQDIGFPPHEAHNLHMRAELMVKVETFVDKSGLTQKEAAKLLGLTQPRLNDLLKGKIDKFSLDALVNMLARAGMKVKLTVRRAA
ncbi:MAG: helix-turn-helix domain-containing protein [Gammaproteobacteria bacterium]